MTSKAISDHIDCYLINLKTNGRSRSFIYKKRYWLFDFLNYCPQDNPKDLPSIDFDVMVALMSSLQLKGYSISYQKGMVTALKGLYKFLHENGLIETNAISKISFPSLQKQVYADLELGKVPRKSKKRQKKKLKKPLKDIKETLHIAVYLSNGNTINDYIDDFLNFIISEKGLSFKTKNIYNQHLISFALFCESKQLTNLDDVDYQFFVSYLSSLYDQGLSSATRRLSLSVLKSFFKFLKREKLVKYNLVKDIEYPIIEKKLPHVLTHEEIIFLLEQAGKNKQGSRDSAIIELLYGSGLRLGELINLKLKDIKDGFLFIKGKGGKERLVPTGKCFRRALKAYWQKDRRVHNLNDNNYVFTINGEKPLTTHLVWKMLKKLAKDCRFRKNIFPHIFRHSFATTLLKNGASLRVIQELLGHSSIDTTSIYLHLNTDALTKAFENAHNRYEFDHKK